MGGSVKLNRDSKEIRAIVFREGDSYVAQCLEFDIATQGGSADEVLARLDLTVEYEFAACERGGQAAEDCIPAAPNYYFSLWESGSIKLTRVNVSAPFHRNIEAVLAKAA